MADTITISAVSPATAVVATDEVTIASVLQHVQRNKLMDGSDGGTDLIGGSAANGLEVDVTRIQSTVNVQGIQGTRNAGAIVAATTVIGPYACTGYNLATVTINTSAAYAGVTAVFELSDDGGTNWYPIRGKRSDTGSMETGPTALSSTQRSWQIEVGGWTHFRVRATAWTSGTANIGVTFQTLPIVQDPSINLDSILGTQAGRAGYVPVELSFANGSNVMGPVGFQTGGDKLPVQLSGLLSRPLTISDFATPVIIGPNSEAPSYFSSTNGTVAIPTTSSTTTSLAYLWHPSTVTARYEIYRIEIYVEGPTTGSTAGQVTTLRITRITAENGTPGGTSQTIVAVDASQAASGGTFRTGAAAPTRATGLPWVASIQTIATNLHQPFVWEASVQNFGKPLICRASVAEGWELSALTNGTSIGSSVNLTAVFFWKEQ